MTPQNSFALTDAGVVITGGGAGIGAALARRMAAAGARLVLADLDGAAVSAVAEEIGARAVVGDAASAHGVAHLLAEARTELGAIDVYCANAGIASHGGIEPDEQVWAQAWDINVMAHVRAAQALLPEWLERGQGHFLAVASAAGLLTSLGSAPYSVTKHGALAFAEWLAATYRHRGVTVQAVCPQGVRTQLFADTGLAGELIMGESAIEPEQVASSMMDGLQDGRFLILPHPEVAEYYTSRVTDTDRWLGAMNKLQRKVEQAEER